MSLHKRPVRLRTLRHVVQRLFAPRLAAIGALALSAPLTMAACSAFETNLQDTDVSYQETARQNFDEGEAAFQDERYNEAIKFFEHVKNKFPYSKYASLADLRMADAHFEREKWLEAADAYRMFVRFHPRHEKAGFATFRVAKAYYEAMSDDVFLFPKAREMDQTATRDAIQAFDEYLARFPKGEHTKEAKELRTSARTRLAEHDVYAAEFYEQRNKWQGAAWRYTRVADEFKDTELAPIALLKAARINEEHLDKDTAKALYQRLLKEHPGSEQAAAAKQQLAAL